MSLSNRQSITELIFDSIKSANVPMAECLIRLIIVYINPAHLFPSLHEYVKAAIKRGQEGREELAQTCYLLLGDSVQNGVSSALNQLGEQERTDLLNNWKTEHYLLAMYYSNINTELKKEDLTPLKATLMEQKVSSVPNLIHALQIKILFKEDLISDNRSPISISSIGKLKELMEAKGSTLHLNLRGAFIHFELARLNLDTLDCTHVSFGHGSRLLASSCRHTDWSYSEFGECRFDDCCLDGAILCGIKYQRGYKSFANCTFNDANVKQFMWNEGPVHIFLYFASSDFRKAHIDDEFVKILRECVKYVVRHLIFITQHPATSLIQTYYALTIDEHATKKDAVIMCWLAIDDKNEFMTRIKSLKKEDMEGLSPAFKDAIERQTESLIRSVYMAPLRFFSVVTHTIFPERKSEPPEPGGP